MTAIIGSWLFRSSTAPLIAKIAVPALIVALACVTPYQVNAMLGLPISAPPASLPAYAELIAFVAHDDDPLVDLWLRQRNAPPRAYETTLNNKLKRILRDAQSRLSRGERVMLVKTRLGTKRTAQRSCARQMSPIMNWTIPSSHSLRRTELLESITRVVRRLRCLDLNRGRALKIGAVCGSVQIHRGDRSVRVQPATKSWFWSADQERRL